MVLAIHDGAQTPEEVRASILEGAEFLDRDGDDICRRCDQVLRGVGPVAHRAIGMRVDALCSNTHCEWAVERRGPKCASCPHRAQA